jgi:chaperonin cofactor prefoldin
MKQIKNSTLLSIFFFGSISMTGLYGSDENMVKTIMKLRSEVEALYSKVDENKEIYRAQMKSYATQKADIEAQISRKEVAFKELKSSLENTKKEILKSSGSDDSLKPIVIRALDSLSQTINSSIPFKTKERLEDINKIKSDLNSDTITAEKALSLAWSSYDDLIRITKENGVFKQKIIVNAQEKLAKVAKLGSVAIYFSTNDNQFGRVVKDGDKYSYKVTTDNKKREQISKLFDSLQKQIRTGYFSLPNALITMENR